MKLAGAVLLIISAAVPVAAIFGKGAESPVRRVVGLLQDLEKKLEEDANTEKDLFEKFKCWSETTLTDKKAAVAKANKRIEYLNSFMADVKSGALSFTSERETLTEAVATAQSQLTSVDTQHNETATKLNVSGVELKESITALKEVIDTLKAMVEDADGSVALKEAKPLNLLGLRGGNSAASGALARRKHGALLEEGLKLSDKYLSTANQKFLHRKFARRGALISSDAKEDEVQAKDVVKTVAGIERSLERDLEQVLKDEAKEDKTYNKVHDAKDLELKTAEEMLAKLTAENAARDKHVADSEEEVEALTAQVADDEKIISEVGTALEQKEQQFDARAQMRLDEINKVGQAVSMLNSDEARDIFAASSASFLQLESFSRSKSRASQALISVYGSTKDKRLMSLNALLHAARDDNESSSSIGQVLDKIDEMITVLEAEEAKDLQKKDNCTDNRLKDEADKQATTRVIEDLNATVQYSQDKIAEIDAEIQKKADQIAEIDASLQKALTVRTAEKAEFEKATQDDTAAMTLLKDVAAKMKSVFEKKTTALLQQSARKASADPDGSPKTWDEPYEGAGTQGTGIVLIMNTVADDLKKDIEIAKKEEADAVQLYEDMKAQLEDAKAKLDSASDNLKASKGEKKSAEEEASEDAASKTMILNALVKKMRDVEPECDFYIKNFAKRSKNRMTEVNGLKQAKTILKSSTS